TSPDAVPQEALQAWMDDGILDWWGKRDDMPAVFAQSHIVCLPSSYGEGVPKVLIEAAACARPIVATNAPGCREIVRHEENGLLYTVGEQAQLNNALETLIDQPTLRQQYGTAGRAIAQAGFSLEDVTSETLSVYEKLLL
ncbi:MAG: glycosyltransferase, partial [Chloroflexota bacterium]